MKPISSIKNLLLHLLLYKFTELYNIFLKCSTDQCLKTADMLKIKDVKSQVYFNSSTISLGRYKKYLPVSQSATL